MEKASACARAVKPEAKILPKKEEMPACGQRALARVSYMTSTRAKAQLTPNQTGQFYTGKLTLFAPGLTLASYKQPRTYIHLPELPTGPNGKLLRRALRAQFKAEAQ